MRQKGGGSVNPTVNQFLNNTSSLRVQGSMSLQPLHGNCSKRPLAARDEAELLNESPLQKRVRRKCNSTVKTTLFK